MWVFHYRYASDHGDIDLIAFYVDSYWWNTFIHSEAYNRLHESNIADGYVRIHFDPDQDVSPAQSPLCTCLHESHCDEYHWEDSFYLSKLQTYYTDTMSTSSRFPNADEIRLFMAPWVQIIKDCRNDALTRSNDLTTNCMRDIQQKWNKEADHLVSCACAFGSRVPRSKEIAKKLLHAITDKYLLQHQWNTSVLYQVSSNVTSFLSYMQVWISGRNFSKLHDMSPRCIRMLARDIFHAGALLEPEWVRIINKQCFDVECSQLSTLITQLVELRKKHLVSMFMMTIPQRLQRWRWNAVRNQNHPRVLFEKGVFGHETRAIDIFCETAENHVHV